jgi:hypothetical protein
MYPGGGCGIHPGGYSGFSATRLTAAAVAAASACTPAWGCRGPTYNPVPPPVTATQPIERDAKIARLKRLFGQGLITKDQFDQGVLKFI